MILPPEVSVAPSLLPILFLAGALAGLIDAIAGGGGLITLPLLLGIGIPPQYALGTNKLQSSFGSASATLHFVKARTVPLRPALPGVVWTLVGAAAGAYAVQQIDPGFLRRIIPYLLLAILCYTVATPKLGISERSPRLSPSAFYPLCGLLLGFYDGFLGPGTGSFWVFAIMVGLGYDLRRGTGHAKLFNFVSNAVSLLVFLAGGHVLFVAGLVMGVGQALGARVGARLVIERGGRFVRPLFILMGLAMTLRLLLYK